MKHLAVIAFALVLAAALAGCEESKPISTANLTANLTGSWATEFDGVRAVVTFNADGTYSLDTEEGSGDGSGGMFFLSGWGKVPPYGTYRLDDAEISWYDETGGAGGAVVKSISGDKLVMGLPEKAAMEWTSVPTPVAATPTMYDDSDGDEDAGEMGEAEDDASLTVEPAEDVE